MLSLHEIHPTQTKESVYNAYMRINTYKKGLIAVAIFSFCFAAFGKDSQYNSMQDDNYFLTNEFDYEFEKAWKLYRRKDYVNAIDPLWKLARRGETRSRLVLGFMGIFGYLYVRGIDIDHNAVFGAIKSWEFDCKSINESTRWFQLKANQGDLKALTYAGFSDEMSNEACNKSYENKFLKMIRRAAEEGDITAKEYLIIRLMHQGKGVNDMRDLVYEAATMESAYAQTILCRFEGMEWCRKAAEQGYGEAYLELCSKLGEYSIDTALEWCVAAGQTGLIEGYMKLSRLFEAIYTIENSKAHALKWCLIAAETDPSQFCGSLYGRTPYDQRDKAKKLVEEWRNGIRH